MSEKWKVVNGGKLKCPVCGKIEEFKEVQNNGYICQGCGFGKYHQKIKGAKYDDNKPRPSTVPVESIEAIMATREYGLAKYAEAEDWRRIAPERWHEALLRHVLAIWEDPTHIDEESGLPSLYHVMTNGAFLCACMKDIFEEKMNGKGGR